jgi:hypothetical protein
VRLYAPAFALCGWFLAALVGAFLGLPGVVIQVVGTAVTLIAVADHIRQSIKRHRAN